MLALYVYSAEQFEGNTINGHQHVLAKVATAIPTWMDSSAMHPACCVIIVETHQS
jgi:hypothetical protein